MRVNPRHSRKVFPMCAVTIAPNICEHELPERVMDHLWRVGWTCGLSAPLMPRRRWDGAAEGDRYLVDFVKFQGKIDLVPNGDAMPSDQGN